MTKTENTLEKIIDRYGLAGTLNMIINVCHANGRHIYNNLQDDALARAWHKAGRLIYTVSGKIAKM